MPAIFQKCLVCGYQRQNAPSALPTCCNQKMTVIAEDKVRMGRKPCKTDAATKPAAAPIRNAPSSRKFIPDAATRPRAQFIYGLSIVHKMGPYDETF